MTEKVKVYHKHGKDDWSTPWQLFDRLHEVYHFTLDAAADPLTAKCENYLTQEMNALEVNWWGRVWLNPPYSQIGAFVQKAVEEVKAQRVEMVCLLVAARPDTKWFWEGVKHSGRVVFLKGRLKFETVVQVWDGADEDGCAPEHIPDEAAEQVVHLINEGYHLTKVDTVTQRAYYARDPAPFPSALLVMDRSPSQQVRWWDWQGGQLFYGNLVEYAFQSGQSAGETPAEVKLLITEVQGKLANLEQKMKDQTYQSLPFKGAKIGMSKGLFEGWLPLSPPSPPSGLAVITSVATGPVPFKAFLEQMESMKAKDLKSLEAKVMGSFKGEMG